MRVVLDKPAVVIVDGVAQPAAVETEADVDASAVRAARRIGVTAGASTPDWLVRRVLRRVSSVHEVSHAR